MINIERVQKNKDTNKNIKIYGYLQSHLYFDEYKDDILELFKSDGESLQYIKDKYSVLFDDEYTCISLHVRMNYGGIDYNFNFFEKSIAHFTEQFPNAYFLVFSNNIDSIRPWFENKNINYLIVNNDVDYLDLWTMSLCKHNIISQSTFSWWGAYLNNNSEKIVIYPNDALRIFWGKLYDHPVCIERKYEHFKPEWIGLEVNTF